MCWMGWICGHGVSVGVTLSLLSNPKGDNTEQRKRNTETSFQRMAQK